MGEQGTHLAGSGDNCFSYTCSHCGMVNTSTPVALAHSKRRRRGNHYPQYTRKFSLGNGPPDWIRDYYSWSEGGKMLGTLVALAIARMPNLESFTWSMPTGQSYDCNSVYSWIHSLMSWCRYFARCMASSSISKRWPIRPGIKIRQDMGKVA